MGCCLCCCCLCCCCCCCICEPLAMDAALLLVLLNPPGPMLLPPLPPLPLLPPLLLLPSCRRRRAASSFAFSIRSKTYFGFGKIVGRLSNDIFESVCKKEKKRVHEKGIYVRLTCINILYGIVTTKKNNLPISLSNCV